MVVAIGDKYFGQCNMDRWINIGVGDIISKSNNALNSRTNNNSSAINENIKNSCITNLSSNITGDFQTGVYAASKDGWIYYENGGDGFKIYKIRTDNTGKEKLNNDSSSNIIAVDSWIYYINENDGNKIYKINNDGTGKQKVCDDNCTLMRIVDDWIYFITNNDIYRIRTNSTEEKIIIDDSSSNFIVTGDSIYFIKIMDNAIYKRHLDGTGDQKINNGNTTSFDIIGELNRTRLL
jgi:hypothetical protein